MVSSAGSSSSSPLPPSGGGTTMSPQHPSVVAAFPSCTGQGALQQQIPLVVSSSSKTTTTTTTTKINDTNTAETPKEISDPSSSSVRMIGTYPVPEFFLRSETIQPAISSTTSSSSKGKILSHRSNSNVSNGSSTNTTKNDDDGITVLKLNKSGSLQTRRIVLTRDRRNLLVTSSRLKSVKKLFKSFSKSSTSSANNGFGSSKVIPIAAIDRIETGPFSPRFIQLQTNAEYYHDDEARDIVTKWIPRNKHPITNSGKSTPTRDDSETAGSTSNGSMSYSPVRNESTQSSSTNVAPRIYNGRCICIVYRATNTQGTMETVDLIIPNRNEYHTVCTTLQELLKLSKQEGEQYTTNLQMVRYHWIDMGKDLDSTMSLLEWITLNERLQVPLNKTVLTNLYKVECSKWRTASFTTLDDHNNNISNNQGLQLPEITVLLERVKANAVPIDIDPIQKLWNHLIESDPVPAVGLVKNNNNGKKRSPKTKKNKTSHANSTDDDDDVDDDASLELSLFDMQTQTVSPVAFLSFLRSEQKLYNMQLEDAVRYIQQLNKNRITPEQCCAVDADDYEMRNPMVGSNENDRLSKSQFIAWLTSDSNDIVDPQKATVGADDMTKPLSYYWINTSHDSYLQSSPHDSFHGKSAFAGTSGPSPRNGANSNKNASTNNTGPVFVDGHMYLSLLYRGIRCLELDVWQDNKIDEPVIGRKYYSSSYTDYAPQGYVTPLSVVLQSIQYFLLQNPTTFPIVLKIENHVTKKNVQEKIAKQLHEYFGLYNLIVKSPDGGLLLDNHFTLPSPRETQGKIIIIGKRPKRISKVMIVRNDDYDDENDEITISNPNNNNTNNAKDNKNTVYDDDDDDENEREMIEKHGYFVIGFDTKGPILSPERHLLIKSPADLLDVAIFEAKKAQSERDEAVIRQKHLLEEVDKYEQIAAEYTQLAGLSPLEVKRRAAKAANRMGKHDHDDYFSDGEKVGDDNSLRRSLNDHVEEEKNSKDEGVEVHEVLPSFIERAQDSYAQAAQDAMNAAIKQSSILLNLKEAQKELERAENNLAMSKQLARNAMDNAKRAAAEARLKVEDAATARERVEHVRELVRTTKDQSSSASVVVQTALTEAKISEKRAQEAEARAARASAMAKKDRIRAEEETRREEDLEQETSDLRNRCKELSDAVTKARERVEKANVMHEKITEQMKLIERSTQYRFEKEQEKQAATMAATTESGEQYYVRHGGSFLAKFEAKFEEKMACRALIKEANEDKLAKEAQLLALKRQFEERAHLWRNQADIAAQLRKAADRSAMIAEELTEHADEEREAANLRNTAREKALANVEDKSHLYESVEAQLAHAERAAAEAAKQAEESKKRADKLAVDAERKQDHTLFLEAVEKQRILLQQAQEEYDASLIERETLDQTAKEEKERLEANSSVCRSATRSAATEHDRARTMQMYQQEAVIAYNKTLMLRNEADIAATKVDIAKSVAEAKLIAAKRAREYKLKRDREVEIPIMLASVTLFHTTKVRSNWNRSLALSNAYIHSISQNVLLQMMMMDETNSKVETFNSIKKANRANLLAFNKTHLCRVFPPWQSITNSNCSNIDPVLAWSVGCQLVAMNYHSPDETLLVGDGRFRQNGSCGYVLKPPQILTTPTTDLTKEPKQSWSFSVLGAYNLPKATKNGMNRPVTNPFVKISLYEGSTEETRILHRTKVSLTPRNGLNPIWDSREIFYFTVQKPSVAMISFSVWDRYGTDSDSVQHHEVFVAGSAFPVSCLLEGYRSISLFDMNHSKVGPFKFASLLVKAKKG